MRWRGVAYVWPLRSTCGAWLTPTPRMNRPGQAAPSVAAPPAMVAGWRAHRLAIPVPYTSRLVWARLAAASATGAARNAPDHTPTGPNRLRVAATISATVGMVAPRDSAVALGLPAQAAL